MEEIAAREVDLVQRMVLIQEATDLFCHVVVRQAHTDIPRVSATVKQKNKARGWQESRSSKSRG
jgi:hypothetical protein